MFELRVKDMESKLNHWRNLRDSFSLEIQYVGLHLRAAIGFGPLYDNQLD